MRGRGAGRAIALALLAWSGCAHETEQVKGPKVDELTIEGARQVDAKDIKGELLTRETSWIPFSKTRRLDRNLWNQDLKRIERYYHARGFYQAEVVSSDIEPSGPDEVRLEVAVREGNPTRVSAIELRGLEGLTKKQRERLRRVLELKEGDIFLEEKWTDIQDRMKDALTSFGYAEAQVTADAKVDLARRTAALALDIRPGTRFHIGDVHIRQTGTPRVEAWRIREQVHQALEGRTWYSQEARREVQERVYDMGVFGAAQVTPGKGDPTTATLPLNVEVTEAPFHEVAYGVGFGFEQRRQEGHLIGQYRHRDFLGGLRELRLDGRAGWAFIPSVYTVARPQDAVAYSGPIALLKAELEQPRLFHPNVRLLARMEVERSVEQAYSYIGGRAHLGFPWKLRTWFSIEPSYNLEVYDLTQGTVDLAGGAPQLLFGCTGTCVLSYLEERLAFDRRDDPQEPKSGYYVALALQQGGGPLGGTFDYLRIRPEARGFASFGLERRFTLAGRLVLGTLIPLTGGDEQSTVVARYFSGGDDMRGFSVQRLSPMHLVRKDNPTGEFNAEPWPVGGNGLFEATVEGRYALTKPLTVAVFLDTGFVTVERFQFDRPAYITDNLLYAVGAGLRYRTPVGPVRLDFAYRLPFGPPLQIRTTPGEQLTYAPSAGCLGFGTASPNRGGAPEPVCALHLSVGEAF